MTKQHQMGAFLAVAAAIAMFPQSNFAPDDFDQIGAARTDFNMKTTCGTCEDFEPVITTGLNSANKVNNGGIPYIAFLDANYPLTNELLLAEWNAQILAEHMWVFRSCLDTGGMVNEQNVETLGSCLQPVVTNDEQVITFRTFVDNAAYDRFKFLKSLKTAQSCFLVAFADCNGKPFGFVNATIQAPAFNIGETKNDKQEWTIIIRFDASQLNPPLAVLWSFFDLVTT